MLRSSPAGLVGTERRGWQPGAAPARSFYTLVEDLRTLTKNETRIQGSQATFQKYTRPTPLQQKAFHLLGVSFRM